MVGTGQPGDPEFDGEGRPGNAVLERRAGELRDPLQKMRLASGRE
jgi:hypothetical protein